MTKSAKGNLEKPGKNVKAKSGLNRSILRNSLATIKNCLEYKSILNNCQLIKVDAKYTSQKCFRCDFISKENRKSQKLFFCQKCNFVLNADINASNNILKKARVAAIQKALSCVSAE